MADTGPELGSTCTVCQHPRVADINAARKAGMAARRLGTQFGVDRQAVSRHFHAHHPLLVQRELPEKGGGAEIPDDATPRESLEAVRAWLEKKVREGTARTDELRELRIVLGALDEMSGGREKEEATLADVAGWPALAQAMMDALEPFPEARQALSAVLKERMG